MSDPNDFQNWNVSCAFYSDSGGAAFLNVNNSDLAFPEMTDEIALALAAGFKAAWPVELHAHLQISVTRTHNVLTNYPADLTANPPAFPS